MTCGPVNVLDANDGQTRVMGCEEQRAEGGVKEGRREARKGVPLKVLRNPGVFPLQPTSLVPPLGSLLGHLEGQTQNSRF